LQSLKRSLGPSAKHLTILLADALNSSQLKTLCLQGRVIISTVGPYAMYGEKLVQACAESGTDYLDLTGELPWIRRMIDKHAVTAAQSGARIVHCCGFDSIPSDLGVFFTQQRAVKRFGQALGQIKMGVVAAKGGFSGGTLASMLNVAREAKHDQRVRQQLANPYWLCPETNDKPVRQPIVKRRYDNDFKQWIATFVMAGINTRVIHRSNALMNYPYGREFLYSEAMLLGKKGRWRSLFLQLGLGIFFLLFIFPPSRWVLQHSVLPKPGEGPSPTQQAQGFFKLRFLGLGKNNENICVDLHGDSDPGYSGTAKMITQAALCLAYEVDKDNGGFYTPAALFGDALIQRLVHYAGIRFIEVPSKVST